MVKFITRTVCMALVAMLCMGSLSAQNAPDVARKAKAQALQELKQAAMHQSAANFAMFSTCNRSQEPVRGEFFEDVESHTNFTINSTVNGWSYIDGDQSETYTFNDILFPNATEAMAYIVFNPKMTTPEIYTTTPEAAPHSGDKYFASFAAMSPPNNDWMISPALLDATKLTFWAKTYLPDYGLERMRVGYSTTGTAQSNFTFLTGSSYVEVPDTWTAYSYDLPAGTKYIAINCVSDDAFIFMVDDITIEQDYTSCPEVTNLAAEVQGTDVKLTWTAATGSPTGYRISDGTTVLAASITATEYMVRNLTEGAHTLGVEALYSDDCIPEKVTKDISITIGAPVQNLTGNCDEGTLTLHWEAPPGQWLSWCGENANGIGGEDDFMVAARWLPEDLADLGIESGSMLTKINFVPFSTNAATFTIRVWKGGTSITDPGVMIGEQILTSSTLIAKRWNEITLTTPIEIDASRELRIGYRVVSTSGRPAGIDGGPLVAGKGDLIYGLGQWFRLNDFIPELNCNWNIRGFAENSKGNPVVLNNSPKAVIGKYVIYKDDVKLGESSVTTYTKSDMPGGESNYCVVAVYDNNAQSEKVCKMLNCGDIPPPCDPVTGLTATFTQGAPCVATLKWTAPAGMAAPTYNIYRDGALIKAAATETEYVDDKDLEQEKEYTWTIKTICPDGESTGVDVKGGCSVGIDEQEKASPAFALFPNPAQGSITFEYPHAEGATVTVEIYNLAGQLVDRVTMAGSQQAYRAEHLANSIYFATLKVDGKIVSTQKMVLIK